MITIRGVEKTFKTPGGDVLALRGVDVEVGDNEFFVLLGPSGSGKTTLLRCVAGLTSPDVGEISLGSRVVYSSAQGTHVAPEDRGLGMVFQSYAIWPHLTVYQNVAMPITSHGKRLSRSVVKERVRSALASVHMEGLEDRPSPLLSGGQQQRVALARALAVNPAALLMDEPLSNLDAKLREEVRVEIRGISKRVGVSVLYVTHDQTEAMALADRVAVMADGRVLQIDTPRMLYERPASPTVANFLGSMTWLDGTISRKGEVETGIGVLRAKNATGSGAVRVGIRPESFHVSFEASQETNVVKGTVKHIEFLGDHELSTIEVNSLPLLCTTVSVLTTDSTERDVYVQIPESEILVFPPDSETSVELAAEGSA